MADLGLAYLGAANLRPARGDFLPRDSILAAAQVTIWPGDVSMYSESALGGTKSVSVQESRSLESAAGDTLCVPDVAAFITKYSEPPDDDKKAIYPTCRHHDHRVSGLALGSASRSLTLMVIAHKA
eukprot:s4735_g1.t1